MISILKRINLTPFKLSNGHVFYEGDYFYVPGDRYNQYRFVKTNLNDYGNVIDVTYQTLSSQTKPLYTTQPKHLSGDIVPGFHPEHIVT